MKDRRGVMRGKCNQCDECEEYVKPSEGARCDYCDHVPTQHVEMIDLGPCKCGECVEYISEEDFSYTDCQYCGCKATQHEGADKLKKKQSSTSTVPPKGTAPDAASSRLPTSSSGSNNGPPVCKFPGCDKPCFTEGGKRHDFCGKTHAMKYKEQAFTIPSYGKPTTPLMNPVPKPHPSPSSTSSDQQPPPPYSSVISASNPQTQLPLGNPQTQLPSGNPQTQLPNMSRIVLTPSHDDNVKQSNSPSPSTTAGSKTASGGVQSSPGVKMCYDCRKQPANPRYNICEGCYKHRTT